ncbi:hypothetical protein [Comamonas piscis]
MSDEELHSGEWHRIAYLPLWALHMLSLFLGLLLTFVVFVAWIALAPGFEISSAPGYEVGAALISVPLAGVLLPVLLHPRMGMSNSTIFGIWPSKFTPYTACTAKLSKRRAIASLLLPIALLVILPLLFAASMNISSGWLVFISCYAALLFGHYAMLALVWAYKIPSRAVIAGRGFEIYWHSAR